MNLKPLKPLRPITEDGLKIGNEYIVKNVNENKKITIEDIHSYVYEDFIKVPKQIGLKGVYTFYHKMDNLLNDEKNIAYMDDKMYNQITLLYNRKKNVFYDDNKNEYKIFKCPYETHDNKLTYVEPDSIKKDKTYLMSSCLQRFTVELDNVKEGNYYKDSEIDEEFEDVDFGDDEINRKYKLKIFSFRITENSKNKDYVKQDDEITGVPDLSLVAYEDAQGKYKWKKYNIYKIFDPQASQIMEHVLGDISFKPKKNSKTSKTLLPELSNLVFQFAKTDAKSGAKMGGSKRKRKHSDKRVRKTRKIH